MTAAGEILLRHARGIVSSTEVMALDMAEHAAGARGIVRIFANLSAIVQFLPGDLQAFIKAHDAIKVGLEERPSDGVVLGVEDGLADVGLCAAGARLRSLKVYPYRHDRLSVVMRPDHPLSTRTSLRFEETLSFDHIGLHAQSSIYLTLRDEARRLGRALPLRIHVPSFDCICRMAEAGIGIGVVPHQIHILFGAALGLAAVPLSDRWAERTISIVTRPGPLTPAANMLVAHLRDGGGTPPHSHIENGQ